MALEQGGSPNTSFGAGATEATLLEIRDYLDTVETKLQSIINNTDTLEANTDGLEGLLTQIRDYIDTVETLLADLANIEANTQATSEVLGGQSDPVADHLVSATISSRLRKMSQDIDSILNDHQVVLDNMLDVLGTPGDLKKDATEDGTLSARVRYLSEKLAEVANSTSDLYNVTASTIIPSLANIEADMQELLTTKPVDLITASLGGSADGTLLTPTAGSKLRIYSLKFAVDADTFTQVSFNGSGASGTLETYFNPKTGGLYGGSRGQNYTELDVDETLDIDVTGTGNYAVNVRYIEVV